MQPHNYKCKYKYKDTCTNTHIQIQTQPAVHICSFEILSLPPMLTQIHKYKYKYKYKHKDANTSSCSQLHQYHKSSLVWYRWSRFRHFTVVYIIPPSLLSFVLWSFLIGFLTAKVHITSALSWSSTVFIKSQFCYRLSLLSANFIIILMTSRQWNCCW